MSEFTETMYGTARSSVKGLVIGEPNDPVRHTWGEVHQRARRIAGGLAAAGVGPGDAVPVLAGAPAEIAPAGQGIWMRGASLTMLLSLDAGLSRETFAVAVESGGWQDPAEVRRMEQQVAHEVVAEVDVRPRNVVVLEPGTIPKTPSGKLRRAHTLALVN